MAKSRKMEKEREEKILIKGNNKSEGKENNKK